MILKHGERYLIFLQNALDDLHEDVSLEDVEKKIAFFLIFLIFLTNQFSKMYFLQTPLDFLRQQITEFINMIVLELHNFEDHT